MDSRIAELIDEYKDKLQDAEKELEEALANRDKWRTSLEQVTDIANQGSQWWPAFGRTLHYPCIAYSDHGLDYPQVLWGTVGGLVFFDGHEDHYGNPIGNPQVWQ